MSIRTEMSFKPGRGLLPLCPSYKSHDDTDQLLYRWWASFVKLLHRDVSGNW